MTSNRSKAIVTAAALPLLIALPLAAAASPSLSAHTTHAPGVSHAAMPADSAHGDHGDEMAPLPPNIPASQSGEFVTGKPFANPPIIRSRGGVLRMTLTAQQAKIRVSGKLINARVYSAQVGNTTYPPSMAPPTLKVRPGDNLVISLVNRLGEPTNLHTHGFFISPMGNSDNVYPTIPDGTTFTYNYQMPTGMAPGSYWYHPHMHGLVEEQVFGGLAGFLHVEGLKKLLPADLQDVKRQYISLKDFQLTKGNSIPNDNIDSEADTNRVVNGLLNPVMSMKPGETQLWHIGNMSADIWYKLALDPMTFTILAEDGNPVQTTRSVRTLMMPPGKRFDVLVQAGAAGTVKLETLRMNTGPEGDKYPKVTLATVNVGGASLTPVALPATLRPEGAKYWRDLSTLTPARYRTFDLTEDNQKGIFYINGRTWSENFINATPIKGTVEQWVFRNYTGEDHPIHIHVNDMQILTINGQPVPSDWVDTQRIPAATKDGQGNTVPGEVVVRMDFRRFAGAYVFHCHILAHEDGGMMGNVQVTTEDRLPT